MKFYILRIILVRPLGNFIKVEEDKQIKIKLILILI